MLTTRLTTRLNPTLLGEWLALFQAGADPTVDNTEETLTILAEKATTTLMNLYQEAIGKYIRMSSRQFKRNLQHDMAIKKTIAHIPK